jgi:integrase
MARSVYKICACKDALKCRHPWWFSYKRAGAPRFRKSLDVVLERHVDSKTVAEQEAEDLRKGIRDDNLPARRRELLGLPPAPGPILPTLTVAQLLETYRERHLALTATGKKQAYAIGAITRTTLPRPDGTSAALGDWLLADVTADAIERLRELRSVAGVRKRTTGKKGSNRVGGKTAANRDLQLLRAAWNWGLDTGYVDKTPFKRSGRTTVKLTKERARSRRLQTGEEERLLPACGTHLRAVVEAALEAACRRGELLSLQWHQVQFEPRPELWLPAGKTKTGKARRVPISTRLQVVLEMRRDVLRATLKLEADETLDTSLFVFGNDLGEHVADIKTAWLAACRRAKPPITDLHFHDLRREAGSRWMESGVSLATIQKWLGHSNIRQTSTYLSTTTAGEHEAMRRFEERIGRLTPIDTEGATPPETTQHGEMTEGEVHQQNATKH